MKKGITGTTLKPTICPACELEFDCNEDMEIHALIEHGTSCGECICMDCVSEQCDEPCYKCNRDKVAVKSCEKYDRGIQCKKA